MSIFTRLPWNSQVKIANFPSIEKSAWFTPEQFGHAERALQLHRVRVAEVEPLERLGDDDRGLAVRREVHVVRVVDGDRRAGLAGVRVDRREAAVGAALGVVGDPQRLQVPRGHDVLRVDPHVQRVDHLHGGGIDHRHRVRGAVRHVDAVQRGLRLGADLVGRVVAVEVVGIADRRHARQHVDLGLAARGRRR